MFISYFYTNGQTRCSLGSNCTQKVVLQNFCFLVNLGQNFVICSSTHSLIQKYLLSTVRYCLLQRLKGPKGEQVEWCILQHGLSSNCPMEGCALAMEIAISLSTVRFCPVGVDNQEKSFFQNLKNLVLHQSNTPA